MARAGPVACALAVCFALCSARILELPIQDEQQQPFGYPDGVDQDSSSLRSELTTDSTAPLIRVTVWSTGGVPSGIWHTFSLAVSSPLEWVSSQLAEQPITTFTPVRDVSNEDLQDMLRRVSCARMRQAMMDYYYNRQELTPQNRPFVTTSFSRTEIRLTPFITSAAGPVAPYSAQQEDDAMSTQTVINFPLRGEMSSMFKQRQDEQDVNDAGNEPSFQADGTSDDFFDATSSRAPDPKPEDDVLSSAGVQQLSSMLHTISGLLSKPTPSADTTPLQDFDLSSSDSATADTTPQQDVDKSYADALAADSTGDAVYYDDNEPSYAMYDSENEALDAQTAGGSDEFNTVNNVRGSQIEGLKSEPEFTTVQQPLFVQNLAEADRDTEEYSNGLFTPDTGSGVQWEDMMPVYYEDGGSSFDDYSEDGQFDWGLFVFTLLSASCVAVWAVVLTQYVRLRAMFCQVQGGAERDSDSVLAPLLEKARAVEVAADHVDPSLQSIDTKIALLKAEYCPSQA